MPSPPEPAPRVAILLSTYNGAAFLAAQLDSFAAQHFRDWTLYWRDDASDDGSPALVRAFCAASRRCVAVRGPAGNVGVLRSYLTLLREAEAAMGPADTIAFADQDDVWLPDKLSRGMAALGACDPARPALYCTRLRLVDARLRPLGLSAAWRRPGGFPAALTQNIATGCTMLLNREAARRVAVSAPPAGTLHDWWSYLVVTAGGGTLLRDETPSVLYRQHGGNAVGVAASLPARAAAALRRGPRAFMDLLAAHVASLLARPELLTDAAREDLLRIEAALQGGWRRRLDVLRDPRLRRQTALESATFAAWFLSGAASR